MLRAYTFRLYLLRQPRLLMKEFSSSTTVTLAVISPLSGEMTNIEGTLNESGAYYSVSKVTTRINMTNLFQIQAHICNSSKDIILLGELLERLDGDNRIVIPNQTQLAKDLAVSRLALSKVLKGMTTSGFAIKASQGVYIVNPFILIGKRTRSNKERERLQHEWSYRSIN